MMANQLRTTASLFCLRNGLLGSNLFKKYNRAPVRFISTNSVKLSEKEIASRKEALSLTQYKPNKFEKHMLVWLKKYPSVEAVPKYVPQNEMERARNKIRIYGMIIMMVVTAFASVGMIYLGKRAASRGENITQMNLDWHKQIKAEEARGK